MKNRTIQEIRAARPSHDGDGVAIQRVSGMQHASMDPILMIDELRSDNRADFGGGFPPHPHRGMQTLTYMKRGGIIHEDNQGNRGEIRGGGAQWMSAGRGIIHSEMPTSETQGLHGFQLWVNLPRREKMQPPRYRDMPGEALAQLERDGLRATAIAGNWQLHPAAAPAATIMGPLKELADQASVLDLVLQPSISVELQVPASESLLAYIYEGSLQHGGSALGPRHLLITTRGDRWTLDAGAQGVSVLLLRGEPLAEPVANYGPFVMNTAAEIDQAIEEYQAGTFAAP